jgi:Tol biopolymer transport system component
LFSVPLAYAAYPGINGDIAFSSAHHNHDVIYQVNPNLRRFGTQSGDLNATSLLRLGASDVEPFYSPDGQTVYFSSDRDHSNFWVIYSVPQGAPESPAHPATELSALPSDEVNNDYAPSVAPDDHTVVFDRDNRYIDTLWAPAGPSSVCTLYTPPEGLAAAGADGSASRAVFNPVNQSELAYVGGDNDLHLLSGIRSQTGSNPCDQQNTVTDVNLSNEVFRSGNQYEVGDDANPDWSPNGQEIVFNSTRAGSNTLFIIDMTTTPPTAYPLWPRSAAASKMMSIEPVFSPSGNEVAFVGANRGLQIYDEMRVSKEGGRWLADGPVTALGLRRSDAAGFDSDPDWQTIPGTPPVLPEFPYPAVLPGAALLAFGLWFGLRAMRARRRMAGT